MAKKIEAGIFEIIKEESESHFLEKVNKALGAGFTIINATVQSNGSGDRWVWFAFLVK